MDAQNEPLEVIVPETPERSYPVYIGAEWLERIMFWLGQNWPHHKPFVVTDSSLVVTGWFQRLIGAVNVPHYIIDPPGEKAKTWQTVGQILDAMEQAALGRDTVVLALGGGTVGDMAGFAAAVFKRGVPVIHIPTTTVAQADSAIGGKTGVDSRESKNAFGCFWHPAAVFIDPMTLQTLDKPQYLAGLVESVKHAAIADTEFFEFLETHLPAILARKPDALCLLARRNVAIKASVVADDPTEKNKRRILNYGHTIGHAIEAASRYKLLHGQAVALGMLAAGGIEKRLGLVEDDRLERIQKLLAALEQPQKIPKTITKKQILQRLRYDKKAVASRPKFVLLAQLGKVWTQAGQYAHDVPDDVLEAVIDSLY